MNNKLVFSDNGHFRIMQIADVQEICMTNPDTVNLIDRALDYAQPDLVVFTGDQVKGYGVSMVSGDVRTKTKITIENVLNILQLSDYDILLNILLNIKTDMSETLKIINDAFLQGKDLKLLINQMIEFGLEIIKARQPISIHKKISVATICAR